MVLALLRDIATRGRSPGGSTITQQLTRNIFPDEIGFAVGNRSWERKIKESLVAMRIEKRYTKEEIFTFYCNQIYFGHGAYGVEAASQLYFRKAAKDLSLEEAATIAGIIQGNVRQSPFVNPEATRRRRNYALDRMAVGRLHHAAKPPRPPRRSRSSSPAIRRAKAAWRRTSSRKSASISRPSTAPRRCTRTASRSGPASIVKLQQAANQAVDRGMRRVDKRRGFRKPRRNVISEGHTVDNFKTDRWSRRMAAGDIVPGVVRWVEGNIGRGCASAIWAASSTPRAWRNGRGSRALDIAQGRRSDRRRARVDRRQQTRDACCSSRRR